MIRSHLLQTTQQFCWNTTQHQKSDEHVKTHFQDNNIKDKTPQQIIIDRQIIPVSDKTI